MVVTLFRPDEERIGRHFDKGDPICVLEKPSSVKRIVSDFPAVKVRMDGPLVIAEGAINGGGPLLRLSSTGGTIYVRRQK